jgi:F-box domain
LRIQLAEQILSATTSELKKPQFVFRPPPLQPNVDEIVRRMKVESEFDLKTEPYIMIEVFKRLGPYDLGRCAVVCKAWNKIVQVRKNNKALIVRLARLVNCEDGQECKHR